MSKTEKSNSGKSETWLLKGGDRQTYRGYQAAYSSRRSVKLPEGGSVINKGRNNSRQTS